MPVRPTQGVAASFGGWMRLSRCSPASREPLSAGMSPSGEHGRPPQSFVVIARELGRCSARRLLMDDRLEGCPGLGHPCRAGSRPPARVSRPVRARTRGAGESPPPPLVAAMPVPITASPPAARTSSTIGGTTPPRRRSDDDRQRQRQRTGKAGRLNRETGNERGKSAC